MCGVVAVARGDIELAMHLLKHRGIRSSVEGPHEGTSIGHVRLPIVGLEVRYDQPVVTADWAIAFVGEVLDFWQERPGLECDLPLVVSKWESWQDGTAGQFLQENDGFWSVVAVDRDDGSIHIVVDYLAQKPIYYRTDQHAIAAASEPDAVAALGPVTPDEVYFSSVIKWGYCPDDRRTPYQEIKKARPGEYVTLRRTPRDMSRGIVDRLVPDPSAGPRELRAEIEAAVERRVLSSNVPVACLLSGGLDSSIVYTLARKIGDVRPYFADGGNMEEKLAACAVAAPVTPKSVDWGGVSLSTALDWMQEPVDLGSLVPQVALAAIVPERVCLTGDGADEFFGGYGRAQRYDSQGSDVYHELVNWHLPRLDRIMMRNRVEVRSPFLARRVAEIALGLLWPLRTGKKILRDLFRSDLPEGIVDRLKVPLRTTEVEHDREARSRELVEMFRRKKWQV